MPEAPDWLTLDGGESVVWTGRPRTMSIARPVVGAVLSVVVVFAAVWVVRSGTLDAQLPAALPSVRAAVPDATLLGVAALTVLLAAARIAWASLTIANVDYVLTDRNLYKKTGVGSETVTRVGLDRIQSTSLSKDVFGNLFDYGSVAVSTAGGSGVELVVSDLDDPDELRTELRRLVNQASAAGGPPGRSDAGAAEETLREVVRTARELRETTAAVEEVLKG